MRVREVVLASNNAGKVKEFQQLLAGLGFDVLAQSQFNLPSVDETGLSFVENAILKARYAAAATGRPALADDSGIEVDALNAMPVPVLVLDNMEQLLPEGADWVEMLLTRVPALTCIVTSCSTLTIATSVHSPWAANSGSNAVAKACEISCIWSGMWLRRYRPA
ncbi:MAG: hypothetical protein EOO68_40250 [Moraxellaceae bacterium]|nr:MAG: hypothetical protein EOO68_40250 [Moraxellaceae bacterium]